MSSLNNSQAKKRNFKASIFKPEPIEGQVEQENKS